MPQMNETRPLGAAGLESVSTLGRCDTQTFSPNTSIAQAIEPRLDLIREDLAANIGAMSATLNAALAMRDANDGCDSMHRARAYWQAIAASARDLASQHKGAK
jgi:hypothetical protein